MKKLILFLWLLFFSINVFSQDEALYFNDWRLYGLHINGNNISIPNNNEVPLVGLKFLNQAEWLETFVCNTLIGEGIIFDDNNSSFTFPYDVVITLGECNDSSNEDFENTYFDFFANHTNTPFTYIVGHVDFPEWWYLIIYKENGDYAEYEESSLSSNENDVINLTIAPNPVVNKFYITLGKQSVKVSVSIYNMLGELVKFNNNYKSNTLINIEHLKAGIYFITLKDQLGNTSTKKLIKQ